MVTSDEIGYVSFGWSRDGDKVMKVFVRDGRWMTGHYLDGEPDQGIVKPFGTHELPTPWAEDEKTQEEAIKELADRNPRANVVPG